MIDIEGIDELSSKASDVLNAISSDGRAGVVDLSKQLNISESTVRRILLMLEEKKLVRRYHGGASMVRKSKPELPVFRRTDEMAHIKRQIAKAAAAHIEEGDRIILTGGTTVAPICEFIQDIPNLTVITDSLLVINALMYSDRVKLISLGGVLNVNEQCFEGVLTSSNINILRPNKMFLGIKGITERDGFMTDDIMQAGFYKDCASFSGQLTVLAAHDKFFQDGIMPLFSAAEADLLITDGEAPKAVIQLIEKQGCRVEVI